MDAEEKVVIGTAAGGLTLGLGYALWRYLHPAGAQGATPNAPTGLELSPQTALSPYNAPILAKATPYAGPGVPTYNWYHFYPKDGRLYPKLVGSTSQPEFLFGRPGAASVTYPVTPAKLYPVGVQVCVATVCSTITRASAVSLAYPSASAESGSTTVP